MPRDATHSVGALMEGFLWVPGAATHSVSALVGRTQHTESGVLQASLR